MYCLETCFGKSTVNVGVSVVVGLTHFGCLFQFTAFFDEFERQTQGENYSSRMNNDASVSPSNSGRGDNRSSNNEGTKDETLTEFFDEFERNTGGEDFRRT